MLSLHALVKNADLSNDGSVADVCAKITAMDVSRKKQILYCTIS